MVKEKATTKAAAKTTKVATRAPRKVAAKVNVELTSENVGFKAGDVYQALATGQKAMTVAEVAKEANITAEEALVGMGWLFKEGKIKGEGGKVVLA